MPNALEGLSRQQRATFCNDYWAAEDAKVATQEFSRDRKMMSVLAVARAGQKSLLVKGAPEAVLASCTQV